MGTIGLWRQGNTVSCKISYDSVERQVNSQVSELVDELVGIGITVGVEWKKPILKSN